MWTFQTMNRALNAGGGELKMTVNPLTPGIYEALPAVHKSWYVQVVIHVATTVAAHKLRPKGRVIPEEMHALAACEIFMDQSLYRPDRFTGDLAACTREVVRIYRADRDLMELIAGEPDADDNAGYRALYGDPETRYDFEHRMSNLAADATLEMLVESIVPIIRRSPLNRQADRVKRFSQYLAAFIISVCKRGTCTGAYLSKRLKMIALDLGCSELEISMDEVRQIYRSYASIGAHFLGNVLPPPAGTPPAGPLAFFQRLHAALRGPSVQRLHIIINQARNGGFSVFTIIANAIQMFPDFCWGAIKTGVVHTQMHLRERTAVIAAWVQAHPGKTLTREEEIKMTTRVVTTHLVFKALSVEWAVFSAQWALLVANPDHAYRDGFVGQSRKVMNLAFLSKELVGQVGGIASVRSYGGIDEAPSSVIPHMKFIKDMVRSYVESREERLKFPAWSSAENCLQAAGNSC